MFVLQLYGKDISTISLITEYENIYDNSIKKLITPYGEFELTIDEAKRCKDIWDNRDKQKGEIKYEHLIGML